LYAELERRSELLEQHLRPFGRVQRVGAMLTLFPGAEAAATPITRFRRLEPEPYARLFRQLLASGIYVAPSPYECLFPSLAHGEAEIEATAAALAGSAS
jgi:glutamate-1-semialdehyde 2,1-aminomutase